MPSRSILFFSGRVVGAFILALVLHSVAHATEETPASPNLFQALGKFFSGKSTPTNEPAADTAAPLPVRATQDTRNLSISPSGKRVALVIGNADYKGRPLANPVNDARAIAKRLKTLDFEVMLRENLKTREIGSVYREFRTRIAPGGAALVFYAGHGIQFKGENYFPAIDADIFSEEDVPLQSLNLNTLLGNMDEAKAGVNLVFLDACRDNPFSRRFRGGARGLAKVESASGTLIHYATRPGSVAEDGDGQNGTYTEALLAQMSEPGVPVEMMLKRVANRVVDKTHGKQEPWVEGSLRGEFYFIFQAPATVNVQQAPTDPETQVWQAAERANTVVGYEVYLKDYPKGKYASAARIGIDALKQPTSLAEPAKPTRLRLDLAELIASQPKIYPTQTLPKTVSNIPILHGLTAQRLKEMATIEQIKELLIAYQRDAEAGDPVAQFSLASMYTFGLGVLQSDAESSKWVSKAAVSGLAIAQTSLGVLYLNVEMDAAEAAKWFRKAAEQGEAIAQNNLGTAYSQGQGVAKDEAEAVKWYRKAADQGFAGAQYNLGIVYENGHGVGKDEVEAVRWYRKAADQGHVLAQSSLAYMCMNGIGIAKNEAEGVKWYRMAANQGDVTSQNNLGIAYANGYGVAKDETEAVKWYRQAADQGYAGAQNNLGSMYEYGRGIAKDTAVAVTWYRKAADQGNLSAIRNLERLR